ncbi:MAG: hypothetical protein ACI37R_01900 [Candidatus Avigastranaerophilus sp.]
MAEFIKEIKNLRHTKTGMILEAIIYALMLILICIYFEGNGQFIYEMVI